MLKPIDVIIRGAHDTGRTTLAAFFKDFLNSNGYRSVKVNDTEPLPPEEKAPFWDRFQRNRERPIRIRVELDTASTPNPGGIIARMRRDAENPERDNIPGIDMLRSWLRGLHMEVAIGPEYQDMEQDEIAERLGEHPRSHVRFAKVKEK